MKVFTMQSFPFPCYLDPLGQKILLTTLFSNTTSLFSSLNVRDQVTHAYKTTGKIVVIE
jgi:hypothetical protein